MDEEAGRRPIQENATLIRGPADGEDSRPIFFDDQAHAETSAPPSEKEHRFEATTTRATNETQSPTPFTPQPVSGPSEDDDDDDYGIPALSAASKMFDRDGKGYLDSTERALRKLDSDNDGFLTIHNVYDLMQSLKESQKLSNELMTTLRKEQKTTMNLKKAVIALVVFALLLSLANIGTSFAAARLAKDTEVYQNNLVAKGTHERLGTTNKLSQVRMKPIDTHGRRRMQDWGLDCDNWFNYGSSSFRVCREEGLIEYDEALHLYSMLCPALGVPNNQRCPTIENGIDIVMLICEDSINAIYGGLELPMRGPRVHNYGDFRYTTFPTTYAGPGIPYNYEGQQYVPDPNGGHCPQSFEVSMTCPHTVEGDAISECFIFSTLVPPYCEIFDESMGGDANNFTMCWSDEDFDEL